MAIIVAVAIIGTATGGFIWWFHVSTPFHCVFHVPSCAAFFKHHALVEPQRATKNQGAGHNSPPVELRQAWRVISFDMRALWLYSNFLKVCTTRPNNELSVSLETVTVTTRTTSELPSQMAIHQWSVEHVLRWLGDIGLGEVR